MLRPTRDGHRYEQILSFKAHTFRLGYLASKMYFALKVILNLMLVQETDDRSYQLCITSFAANTYTSPSIGFIGEGGPRDQATPECLPLT